MYNHCAGSYHHQSSMAIPYIVSLMLRTTERIKPRKVRVLTVEEYPS